MAKKLKETYRHTDTQTHIQTYRLPLVVLSAALQQKRVHTVAAATLLSTINEIFYDFCNLEISSGMRIRIRDRSDPVIFGPPDPDPDPVLFSTYLDPDP